MTAVKLTHATARDTPGPAVIRDHEVLGLQLRIRPAGRSWFLWYRTRAGIERRPKLGTYPEMSLARAREVARDLKERIARGEDPSQGWAEQRAAPTMAELCDRYLAEWAPRHKAPQSVEEDRKLVIAHVKPGLGSARVADLDKPAVERFLDDVRARRFVGGRGTAPGAANHTRALLSKMLNLAMTDYGWRSHADGNPVKGTIKFQLPKRRRKAEPDELRRVLAEIDALAADYPGHAAALMCLFVTGLRPGEVLGATWGDFDGARLVFRAHKTSRYIGDKIVPLPAGILATISAMPQGRADDRLFGKIDLRWAWARIRAATGCHDLQMRDARRTFASYALSAGLTLDQIGDLFGHTTTATTRGYSWMLQGARETVAERAAERILSEAKGDV
jgi:integrase